jgi:hypothetical protein
MGLVIDERVKQGNAHYRGLLADNATRDLLINFLIASQGNRDVQSVLPSPVPSFLNAANRE